MALPFADELHKEHPELASLSLEEHRITGTASFNPVTQIQSFVIQVVDIGRTFTGSARIVSAQQPAANAIIIGTIAFLNTNSLGPGPQDFTFSGTANHLTMNFLNNFGVADRWLASNPVFGLIGGPYRGNGSWA